MLYSRQQFGSLILHRNEYKSLDKIYHPVMGKRKRKLQEYFS